MGKPTLTSHTPTPTHVTTWKESRSYATTEQSTQMPVVPTRPPLSSLACSLLPLFFGELTFTTLRPSLTVLLSTLPSKYSVGMNRYLFRIYISAMNGRE